MYFRREIGIWGENLACKYLEANNYKIIERNFLCRQGEIDIIEVKTRSNFTYGNPIESVNKNKQKHMKMAIKYYIYKNHMEKLPVRIDVIEVYIKKEGCKINHIKQII